MANTSFGSQVVMQVPLLHELLLPRTANPFHLEPVRLDGPRPARLHALQAALEPQHVPRAERLLQERHARLEKGIDSTSVSVGQDLQLVPSQLLLEPGDGLVLSPKLADSGLALLPAVIRLGQPGLEVLAAGLRLLAQLLPQLALEGRPIWCSIPVVQGGLRDLRLKSLPGHRPEERHWESVLAPVRGPQEGLAPPSHTPGASLRVQHGRAHPRGPARPGAASGARA
mmetsp:Transcript_37096/g.106114  ORF Transcript_37096/g.106114 Transcript_37096/m.106114 type:complete len:227 (+) Transcript_37096:299-979(+)